MEIGCNIGKDIITKSGQTIHIVTWPKDPMCGITKNMYNFNGKQCFAAGKYGNEIEYNQSDINCLPLDGWMLACLIAVFGFMIIKRKFI